MAACGRKDKVKKTVLAIIMAVVLMFAAGCGNFDFSEETGGYIVTPNEALSMAKDDAILIDVSEADVYAAGHAEGAINIPMSALVVNEPYKNMLPDADQVEQVMSAAGVTETDTLLVYDNEANMNAARVQWTLNYFGNFNIKVVSGGIAALGRAGAVIDSTEAVTLEPTEYNAGKKQRTLLAKMSKIEEAIDADDGTVVIIDTRSAKEYGEGTIPGAYHIEYVWNNYGSGEYKNVRDLQSTYIDQSRKLKEPNLLPNENVTYILFCKTSVRAAQTYTAMKDMGYDDVRVYDGAWLEWSDNQEVSDEPAQTIAPTVQDAS